MSEEIDPPGIAWILAEGLEDSALSCGYECCPCAGAQLVGAVEVGFLLLLSSRRAQESWHQQGLKPDVGGMGVSEGSGGGQLDLGQASLQGLKWEIQKQK